MSTRKADLLLKGLIVALLVALIAVAGGTLEQRIVVSGDNAPDFQLVADNGKTMTRSDFGGKLLVLNFSATW